MNSKQLQQAHLATARFDPETGKPLTAEQLQARPAYPWVQKLLYIPSVTEQQIKAAKKAGIARVKLKPIPYPYKEQPLRLYSLNNPEPVLPILPTHGQNCYSEDLIHDWKIINQTLDYSSRYYHEGGVWVLLEFESKPTLVKV